MSCQTHSFPPIPFTPCRTQYPRVPEPPYPLPHTCPSYLMPPPFTPFRPHLPFHTMHKSPPVALPATALPHSLSPPHAHSQFLPHTRSHFTGLPTQRTRPGSSTKQSHTSIPLAHFLSHPPTPVDTLQDSLPNVPDLAAALSSRPPQFLVFASHDKLLSIKDRIEVIAGALLNLNFWLRNWDRIRKFPLNS